MIIQVLGQQFSVSKDSLALIDSGSYGLFALYAAGSVALGIAATALGLWLAK